MNRDPQAWARLARAIREARGHHGWTQAELADRAAVSLAAVGAAEKATVPERRMPPTLAKLGRALGWPPGTVEAVLDGGEPPGGWVDASSQGQVDARIFESAMRNAMVTAADGVTASEIRAAVNIAMDELRRHGVIFETDGLQPNATK